MALRLIALSIALAAFFAVPAPVSAQVPPKPGADDAAPTILRDQKKQSHPEHVILSWYKTASLTPDYTKWAALSPFLDEARDTEIAAVINRETNRLSKAYGEFDATEPLVVHTQVNLDDYSTLNGALTFNEFSDKTFFTYSLYGEHIAIVPRDVKNFGTIPVSKTLMDDMLAKSRGSRVNAELLLKPVLVDAKEPFRHDNRDYKLMLADIAELNLWTVPAGGGKPALLWTWRADWYQPKQDTELLNLKQELEN